jgi:hypothetical protein
VAFPAGTACFGGLKPSLAMEQKRENAGESVVSIRIANLTLSGEEDNVKRLIAMVPVFSLLLSGCGSLIKVTRQPRANTAGSVAGIPFYVKAGICKHQTIWLQPIYSVTLKMTFTPDDKGKPANDKGKPANDKGKPADDKAKPAIVSSRTLVLTLAEVQSADFKTLMQAVNEAQPDANGGISAAALGDIEDAWTTLSERQPADPYRLDQNQLRSVPVPGAPGVPAGTDRNRVLQVANETVAETYVDYSTMYFFNTSKPLAGSAQGNVELAGDGTMTKGSAQIESKTLQTFLDLLPVKDVLGTVAKGAVGAALAPTPVAGTVTYDLSISVQQVWKHTHYKYLAVAPPCAPPAGELITANDYSLLTEDVTEPKKKPADGQTISVNGSIQLPKKDDAKPK